MRHHPARLFSGRRAGAQMHAHPAPYGRARGADRITADGSGLLRVLYLSEGNTVRCFEQNIPFSKSAETTLPQNACVHASASTEYVNCRVVSPRKMDVHGSISVSFKAYCKEPGEIICDCDGAGVQTRKEIDRQQPCRLRRKAVYVERNT